MSLLNEASIVRNEAVESVELEGREGGRKEK